MPRTAGKYASAQQTARFTGLRTLHFSMNAEICSVDGALLRD
jgi:hypothetical protein